MDTKIDESRLDLCIDVGRHFYAAAEIVMEYLNIVDECRQPSLALTNCYFTVNDGALVSVHPHCGFREPLCSYNGTVYFCRRLFCAFGRKMKINKIINFNANVLHYRYNPYNDHEFIHAFMNQTEDICTKIIPLEVSVDNIHIQMNYPGPTIHMLYYGNLPLIFLLYRSDEAVAFFRKITALILHSTHLVHGALINDADRRFKFNLIPSRHYRMNRSNSLFFESIEKSFRMEYDKTHGKKTRMYDIL